MEKEGAENIFLVVSSSLVVLLLLVLVVNLFLSRRKKELKSRMDLLLLKARLEEEISKTQLEVAENTLNDIARELHDDLGQRLTLTNMHLHRLKTTDPELMKRIAEMRETFTGTIDYVRSISKTLGSDYISSFGIREAAIQLFKRVEKSGMRCIFQFPDDIKFRAPAAELIVFRIVQELVNNTLKHAEASEISLSIAGLPQQIRIVYADNGKGLPPGNQGKPVSEGLGLLSIRNRIDLLKGTMTVDPAPVSGFRMEFQFPNTDMQ